MPKKIEPVKNHGSARFRKLDTDYKIEEALRAAEDTLELCFSDSSRDDLRSIIECYLAGVYSGPSNNDIKRALQNLHDTSENFLNAVNNFESNSSLKHHLIVHSQEIWFKNPNIREDAIKSAKIYNELAFIALNQIPAANKGRPRDTEYSSFISNLAGFFEKEAGEEPKVYYNNYKDDAYGTDFGKFVWEIEKAIDPDNAPKSPNQNGKTIQRILKRWHSQKTS